MTSRGFFYRAALGCEVTLGGFYLAVESVSVSGLRRFAGSLVTKRSLRWDISILRCRAKWFVDGKKVFDMCFLWKFVMVLFFGCIGPIRLLV